jgi:hypothetical protein
MNEHLADFDRHSAQAVEMLVNLLNANKPLIIALARTRFIRGFEMYPEGRLFAFGTSRLTQETLEELADAVVYQTRQQAQTLERAQPSS